MRVALVYQGRENLELEYLTAGCKAAGHEVLFAYDPGAFTANDNVLHLPRLARRYDRAAMLVAQLSAALPDVVFFYAESITWTWTLNLARRLRPRLRSPFVFGGWHPTMAPQAVLAEPEADVVVVGELEETFAELLDALAAGRSLAGVRGLYYRDGNEVLSTGTRPPIADLDSLPWPDKELFAGEIDVADDYALLAGRGCPLSCTYCRENTMRRLYGPANFRRRKIGAIIEELETRRRQYRFREVMIHDPILLTPKDWVLELLAEYKRRIGVRFRCFGQFRWIDQDVARALKEAGCYTVEFGLQTTNARIRRDILDRPETDRDVRQGIAVCDRFKLRYDIDHIFGLPGETPQDFLGAAHLYADARYLNRVKVHMLAYLPDAPIIRIARHMGLADEEDERRAARGEIGDIARTSSVRRPETAQAIREWKTFYKVMPLLGRRLGHAFARRGWNRWFGRLPKAAEIFLQILVAVRGRDYRFWLYAKYMLIRLRRHRELRRAAAGMSRP